MAAVNRGKRELSEPAQARLLAAWTKAAENVATAVENGDLKASLFVLRDFAPPFTRSIGSDDPVRLAEDAAIAEREARTEAHMRRLLPI